MLVISRSLVLIFQEVDRNNQEPVPVFIIGNKCDLANERLVSADQGKVVRLVCSCRPGGSGRLVSADQGEVVRLVSSCRPGGSGKTCI